MKKRSIVMITIGIVILILGAALFGITAAHGAVGYHKDNFHVGFFDGGFALGVRTVRNIYETTEAVEVVDTASEQIPPIDETAEEFTDSEPSAAEMIFAEKTGAGTLKWDLSVIDDLDTVRVEIGAGGILIKNTETPGLSVNGIANVEVSHSNGTLFITADDLTGLSGEHVMLLQLPKDLQMVVVESSMGAVEIENIEVGDLYVHASMGAIDLENVKAASADLDASMGKIEADDVVILDLVVNADMGDVELEGKISEAQVNLSCGKASLEGHIGNFTIENSMGDIEIDLLDPPGDHDITLETSAGDIRVDEKKIVFDEFTISGENAVYTGTVHTSLGDIILEYDD